MSFFNLKQYRQVWKKKSRTFVVSKRQVFVVVTAILSILLVATQFSQSELQFQSVLILVAVTYVLSAVALREDLRGIEFLTLFILPVSFTVAVSLFYFLLPPRLLSRLPIALLYAAGMYAILLTENIYNVAAERTIQLLRAAQSVGFLITLVTVFFLIDAILSFRNVSFVNMIFVFVAVFPLALQSLWSMKLASHISRQTFIGSLAISMVIAESAFAFSFWPIETTIEALFLATIFYTAVGMSQQHIVGRLFRKTKLEFISVLVLVFFLVIFTTKWGLGKF